MEPVSNNQMAVDFIIFGASAFGLGIMFMLSVIMFMAPPNQYQSSFAVVVTGLITGINLGSTIVHGKKVARYLGIYEQ